MTLGREGGLCQFQNGNEIARRREEDIPKYGFGSAACVRQVAPVALFDLDGSFNEEFGPRPRNSLEIFPRHEEPGSVHLGDEIDLI